MEVSDPGTLWPQQRFQSARRMRSILRPEEAGGGRGSYTDCHPANRRLSNLTFSWNGVRRRLRAGFVLWEAVSVWFSRGPGPARSSRDAEYGSDSRVCRVSGGQRWVPVVPPLASETFRYLYPGCLLILALFLQRYHRRFLTELWSQIKAPSFRANRKLAWPHLACGFKPAPLHELLVTFVSEQQH